MMLRGHSGLEPSYGPHWDTGAQPQRVLPPLHTDGKSANIPPTYEDQDTCDRHQTY